MSTRTASRPRFSPDRFGDTRFASAADKSNFANALVRFVSSGFKETLFTRAVYDGLHLHFDHIAHFDRHGFYATWFERRPARVEFLQDLISDTQGRHISLRISPVRKVELWGDVVEALGEHVDWFRSVADREAALHVAEVEAAERSQLRVLLAKYGEPGGETTAATASQPRHGAGSGCATPPPPASPDRAAARLFDPDAPESTPARTAAIATDNTSSRPQRVTPSLGGRAKGAHMPAGEVQRDEPPLVDATTEWTDDLFEDSDAAFEAGRRAFAAGAPPIPPYAPEGRPVGGNGDTWRDEAEAFTRGWHSANGEASVPDAEHSPPGERHRIPRIVAPSPSPDLGIG